MEYNSRRNKTHYSPHTITLDTNANTVIRKNDLAIVTETKPRETIEKPRLIYMVACKAMGEYKRHQEKIKKFCLEEKANKAREEEEKTKHAKANNHLQPTTTQQKTQSTVTQWATKRLLHLHDVTRKNIGSTSQTKQQPKSKPAMRPTPPGSNNRPQWLKNAHNRIMKKIHSNDFNTKSKDAAIQYAKENSETKQEKARKLLYPSSSENMSITSLDKSTLKFPPTVKVFSIPSDSPGTSYEIVASSTPNDFMNSNLSNFHKNSNEPSCSYTADPNVTPPKGIMKSTPKVYKIVTFGNDNNQALTNHQQRTLQS